MKGNIEKMLVHLAESENGPVQYKLPIGGDVIAMNDLIGKTIKLHYHGEIHCIACQRKTNKSFGQGFCYPCFRDLARCDMCIMKPETCHFDQGTCREPEWAQNNCMQPHFVYLANSSGVKVGITRGTQIPTRWIDQGASQALPIFSVQTRKQSGLLEVALKQHVSDRTDWRKMLKGDPEIIDLAAVRDELFDKCQDEIAELQSDSDRPVITALYDENIVNIQYPVTRYPEKVKSLNFDKQAELEGELLGIKGQYLILDTGVLNIRKFGGYLLSVTVQ